MTDLRKAAEMALEALTKIIKVNAMDYEYKKWAEEAHETLRQALAQPKQEPIGWLNDREEMYFDKEDAFRNSDGFIQPLYTTPPKREWIGLTDEEKKKLVDAFYGTDIQRLEATEAKLKEKNQ